MDLTGQPVTRGRAVTIADAMLRHPTVHTVGITLADAWRVFDASPRTHLLLIAAHGRLITTLSRTDVDRRSFAGKSDGRTVRGDARLDEVHRDMLRGGQLRLAVVNGQMNLLGLLCLKSSGEGFSTDDGVAALRRSRTASSAPHVTGPGGAPPGSSALRQHLNHEVNLAVSDSALFGTDPRLSTPL